MGLSVAVVCSRGRAASALALVVLALAACSPNDSEAIQSQTRQAQDAFNTRVAVVQGEAQEKTTGQDLIAALMELDGTATEQIEPTVTESLPDTALIEPTAAGSLSDTALIEPTTMPPGPNPATPAPTQPSPTEATPVWATNTLAPPSPPVESVTVFAAFDDGRIDRMTNAFVTEAVLSADAAVSMEIDGLGSLYVGSGSNVLVFHDVCSPNVLSSGDVFGFEAGIAQVQGIDASTAPDRLLVVDSSETAPAIVAFGRDGSGTLSVLFRTTNLGGKRPWGLAYDTAHDRLFVTTTEGSVLVFDDYYLRQGTIPPSRIITPFDVTGTQQVSIDLRGIVYVPSGDTLILSGIGSSIIDPNDGQILLIDSVSQANGSVPVRAQIRGNKTRLGDPYSIVFDGSSLYVAESSNGFLMRYDDILAQSGVLDIEANSIAAAPQVRAVSVALQNSATSSACTAVVDPT